MKNPKLNLKQQKFSSFPKESHPYISQSDTEDRFNITCVEKTTQTTISPLSSENLPKLTTEET